MARKQTAASKTRQAPAARKRRPAAKRGTTTTQSRAVRVRPRIADALMAPMPDTDRREVAGVTMDIGRAGAARVKRVTYPAGFRWSADMKPVTGTDLCMHGHVGFLARGEIHIEYADGCLAEFKAPQIVVIDPGHDGWVVGSTAAVLIEFDFERDTVRRIGLPDAHRH